VSWLALYIPLGILGFVRWTSWVIRQIPASLYRPVQNDYRLPLTIVVPVYQEEPELFRNALASWLANDVDEVICVIDETDTEAVQIAGEYPKVRVIVTNVPGKRDALRRGWEAASTPLVALVDSDTIWAADVAQQVCMPFADSRVAGVTARQNASDPKTVWQHLNDMYLDYRYSHELASQSMAGQALSCLSGRTAVYRRDVLLQISDRFMNESFWGVPCLSGDDKRLSMLILEDGHQAVLQRTARVWSQFPPDARTFFRQRLRWSRNTWRSDLRALSSGWLWRRPFLAFWMVDKAVSSFTLLAAPIFMTLALVNRHFVGAAILAVWWMFSRSAKLLFHLTRRPMHLITMMPFYRLISFVMSLVKIQALLTVRRQRWLTRDVQVSAKTGQVVRAPQQTSQSAQPAPERVGS
jgi:hyaluronan synthase